MINARDLDVMMLDIEAWVEQILTEVEMDWQGARFRMPEGEDDGLLAMGAMASQEMGGEAEGDDMDALAALIGGSPGEMDME